MKPPNNEYNEFNTRIHHIRAEHTISSPRFDELWQTELRDYLEEELVIAHNASFDISCLTKALAFYKIPQPILWYGCTVQFFRVLMPGLPNYKLGTLSKMFDIYLNHHDAASDTEATAHLVLRLSERNIINANDEFYKKTGYEWGRLTTYSHMPTFHRRSLRPEETISSMWEGDISQLEEYEAEGKIKTTKSKQPTILLPEAAQKLKGLVVAFTGELKKMLRNEAIALVEQHGGTVGGVSRKVNIVVIGIQISANVDSSGLSGKEKKAQDLLSKGYDIQILTEDMFLDRIN